MAINKAYTAYQATSISTSKPEELTLMLYNGLVRFITQAKKALEEKDINNTHENLIRAQDIILEFQITLNMDIEISHNLMLLYDYMYRRLVDANLKKDIDAVNEVLKLASQLRDTWSELVKKMKADAEPNNNIKSIAK